MDTRALANPRAPELWGGVECTVNRVNDVFHDQLEFSGHPGRIEDLALFAGLGIKALRFPVLWERVEADPEGEWAWTDTSLRFLRDQRIEPVVGLLHHGSGPAGTHLLDPQFPEKFEKHAASVAARYPWIRYYCPVNEPLTTARFSALYGHWYPHFKDGTSFVRALLIQCKAIVLGMQAIRRENPAAVLVQTEDIGRISATPLLQYQADFENERRWLSWDLLCGKVTREHPLWDYLQYVGISEADLQFFVQCPCPPQLLGINHYVTSDRFLDDRLHLYPASTHGGNGRHRYADVEAVRVDMGWEVAFLPIIEETWDRYRLPIALTEVHLGCTGEEQVRWFQEAWKDAVKATQVGIPVEAVTAWSLLGAYDWNSLVTERRGHYEPGVFCLSGGVPQPTALGDLIRNLPRSDTAAAPVVSSPGWWRRPDRICYPQPVTHQTRSRVRTPLVITGANGTLGRAFVEMARRRGIPTLALTHQQFDITLREEAEELIAAKTPWAVINTAGLVDVDGAEHQALRCYACNALGPRVLAEACVGRSRLVTFSSDLVFGGEKNTPYLESDLPYPLNEYGRSKAEAERLVNEVNAEALVVRTSAFFGLWDNYGFAQRCLQALSSNARFSAPEDQCVSPTFVPELVDRTLDLLVEERSGIWHLANRGEVSWAAFARRLALAADLDESLIDPVPSENMAAALRPKYSALGTERGVLLRPLDQAIQEFVQYRQVRQLETLEERR